MSDQDREVCITLSSAAFGCLKENLSETSPAYAALKRADEHGRFTDNVNMPVDLFIVCGETDAETLFAVAEQSCPTAVHPIKIAIRQAKEKREKQP